MLKTVDEFLNKITMYRLTLYYLGGLLLLAIGFSLFKLVPFQPQELVVSAVVALLVCGVTNWAVAKIFAATTNIESVFITALILVLIVPAHLPSDLLFIIEVSILSMVSKYIFTVEKRHLLNPAAAAVVAVALLTPQSATWWVGTPVLLPFVVIGGILLVRKIQREKLVLTFLGSYLFFIIIAAFLHHPTISAVVTAVQLSFVHTALFFFACVMLTEPLTSPPTKLLQQYYAILVAFFYATLQFRLFGISFTPEIALCLGNVFSYVVSPKFRLELRLKAAVQLSPDTMMFHFAHADGFAFVPGQYMEWTLPHKAADNRGNRRYFSLASSPTEAEPMMLVKFYEPASSYKRALLALPPNGKIVAAQLAGDFVLPKDLTQPLVFIAGGVGIAPFRSMIKYIVDQKLKVNIVVFFANKHAEDIVCDDVLEAARANGVRTVYILTDKDHLPNNWQGLAGHLTAEMLEKQLVDYVSRTYYVSGPQNMVQSFESILAEMKIPKKQIRVDFFPGY